MPRLMAMRHACKCFKLRRRSRQGADCAAAAIRSEKAESGFAQRSQLTVNSLMLVSLGHVVSRVLRNSAACGRAKSLVLGKFSLAARANSYPLDKSTENPLFTGAKLSVRQ